MAMPFGDFGRAVISGAAAAGSSADRRQPHGAAEIAGGLALAPLPLSHSVIRPTTGSRSVRIQSNWLRRCRRDFAPPDHRHLHAEADAEIWYVALARELRSADLPFGAALSKPPGTRMPLTCSRNGAGSYSRTPGLDPVQVDPDLVGDAAAKAPRSKFVGVLHAGVLADDRDGDLAFGLRMRSLIVRAPSRRFGVEPEGASSSGRGLRRISLRHRIDVVDVARFDHGALRTFAEQRELAPLVLGDLAVVRHSRMSGWCRWRGAL